MADLLPLNALIVLTAFTGNATDYAAIEQGDPSARGARTRAIPQLMRFMHVPGLSIAIWDDAEIVFAKAYGVTDAKTKQAVTTETQFQAASISKPVNAMAVVKAVEEGRLRLDEDINSILKSWRLPKNRFARNSVTLRMLLSHTAGTTTEGFDGYTPQERVPSIVDVLNGKGNSPAVEVRVKPFSRRMYSGGGVCVVQLALMDTYRKAYAALLKESVLDPAQMNDSSFGDPLSPKVAAHGHDQDGEVFAYPWRVFPEQAAAGLWTTPSDLARFGLAVQQAVAGEADAIITRHSARQMSTPVGIGDYALGFRVSKRGDATYLEHGGSNQGFKAMLLVARDGAYGVAIMNNSDSGSLILRELRDRVGQTLNWPGFD